MNRYDMIVIGTGAANIVLEAAQQKGLRCAQIERGKFGGTCLTRGCIPTKVLVTAADRLYEMREAEALGLSAENVSFDWQKVSARVWQKIDESKLNDARINIKSLDWKPQSPSQRALTYLRRRLFAVSDEYRRRLRSDINALSVSDLENIRSKLSSHLGEGSSKSVCIISGMASSI